MLFWKILRTKLKIFLNFTCSDSPWPKIFFWRKVLLESYLKTILVMMGTLLRAKLHFFLKTFSSFLDAREKFTPFSPFFFMKKCCQGLRYAKTVLSKNKLQNICSSTTKNLWDMPNIYILNKKKTEWLSILTVVFTIRFATNR